MPAVTVGTSFLRVDAAEWDALVGDGSPFLEHTFLAAMEDSGCAAPATGWHPRPVLVRDDAGRLVAGAPAWVKTHSMGEFVYDHGWAAAADRAGIRYYPKLVVGVPFTPVTGSRLLGDPKWRPAVLQGLRAAAADTHGLHVLFDTIEEAAALEAEGLFPRLQYQFHWRNQGFRSWEDFALLFPSKQRNKLRRERKEAAKLRYDNGLGPDRATIDALYDFYLNTTDRFVWGQRYLSRELFRHLGDVWAHRLHAVVARDDSGAAVGGALNVVKGDRLYGRYWGAVRDVPFLHFEVCYHQGIDYAIAHDLAVFEPGHGGEHKYRRGFLPTITWSSHELRHPGLNRALKEWSAREAEAVRLEVDELRAIAPIRAPEPS